MPQLNILNLAGVILDVDGVIWLDGSLAPDAHVFINILNQAKIPFVLLTNDCTSDEKMRLHEMSVAGLKLAPEKLITPIHITVEWLISERIEKVLYLGCKAPLKTLRDVVDVREKGAADAVIIGDYFDNYDRGQLEAAVQAIIDGAQLVAMQSNRTWSDGNRARADNGFWVAGIEYVTGVRALVMGKPSIRAYSGALHQMGVSQDVRSNVLLISDDASSDLHGGKSYGLSTALVSPNLNEMHYPPACVDLLASSLSSLVTVLEEGASELG